MLKTPFTHVESSVNMPVLSTETSILEGSALAITMENGSAKVHTDGSANADVFAGVAWNRTAVPSTAVMVETITVPADSPYTVNLKKTAKDQVRVIGASSFSVLTTEGTSPADGAVQLNAAKTMLTFHADEAGLTFTVYYRYDLTLFEARMMAGDGNVPVQGPIEETGVCGVIRKGIIYTDQFDETADWTVENISIKMDGNGEFQVGGTGASVTGYVMSAPTADNPFLGLYISA